MRLPGVAPGGGWSGLELTNALYTHACNLENTSRLNQFKLALTLILVGYYTVLLKLQLCNNSMVSCLGLAKCFQQIKTFSIYADTDQQLSIICGAFNNVPN